MDNTSRNRLDAFMRFVVDNGVSAAELQKVAPALTGQWQPELEVQKLLQAPASRIVSASTVQARVDGEAKKLTIGMATYDDYDGVYFTLQAIRLYHSEILNDVEFVVVDNNPEGPCGQALQELGGWISNYRYIARAAISGTAVRDCVFQEALGKFVLCIDCHILIAAGALKRLLDYFDAHPDTADLLQGPMIYDDLLGYSTHFEPQWSEGMYGVWGADPRGADPDQPPFEIPMQGLGLFACRRSAWPGFNPAFRGFGGEEGYIHEKFRQRGAKALCLPSLRWMHRFGRPRGVAYPVRWEDRVRNYVIGFHEVGWDTQPLVAHFRAFLGEPLWLLVASRLSGGEITGPAHIARAASDLVAVDASPA
jgi:Glycosyl transferase family 2